MRVIILSWEYPPRIVGKLAHYVVALATKLAKRGVDSHVITYHDSLTGDFEDSGVKIHRVTNPVKTHISVLTWALTLNQEIERAAANVYYQVNGQIDLLDVHEWHFIPAAVTLKRAFKVPFTYSIESLEDHRAHGVNAPLNMAIKSIEQLGADEADCIIVKSEWMASEVKRILRESESKTRIANLESENGLKATIDAYKSIIK